MRDPKRIPIVIKALEKLWKKWPDQRITQVVSNLGNYYDEDDVILKRIEEYLKDDQAVVPHKE